MRAARQYSIPIYAPSMGVSMTFWKKLYFAMAIISAVFLILSLF